MAILQSIAARPDISRFGLAKPAEEAPAARTAYADAAGLVAARAPAPAALDRVV